MHIAPFSSIVIGKRQRKMIDKTALHELKEKIAEKGVMHPPVYWLEPGDKALWHLVAGERRTRAIMELHAEGREVRCNDTIIPKDHIPITQIANFDEVGRFEAELDENVARVDLTWQDRTQALADLHAMRTASNPKQTITDTAAEVMSRNLTQSTHPIAVAREITQAVHIAEHLDNDKIANARNPAEAASLIYKLEEEKVLAALARRKLSAMPRTELTIDIRHGDMLEVLPRLPSDTVDLILGDPPYGIGAGGKGFRARTVHHHNYEDTPENARKIAMCALTEGFRICKQRANILIFCDIDMFPWLKEVSANMGWSPFRRPLIWKKSESEGMAPWGGQGPRITTEFIFFATKGQRGMHVSPVDVFDVKRVPRRERLHAAEKPVELLSKLIGCTTLPGETVLDFCCGSGSTMVACKETKRMGIGIERDKDYYNTAMANVFGNDVKGVGAS